MNYDEYLPVWAKDRAHGEFVEHAALWTKDGRRTGNAYLAYWYDKPFQGQNYRVAKVVTDAGTILNMSARELEELYHPPIYTMLNPLPAVADALKIESMGYLDAPT